MIDYDRLHIARRRCSTTCRRGGRRLVQRTEGYDATIVSGVPVHRDGEATGAVARAAGAGSARSLIWLNAGTAATAESTAPGQQQRRAMTKMKAAIFVEPGRIVLDEKPIPDVGPLDALMRITTTTICGTDVHILKGEYPVATGPDHRPRAGRRDREARLRRAGLSGGPAGDRRRHHAERPQRRLPVRLPTRRTAPARSTASRPMGGWRFGNTIDGCQAEYVLVPDAMANLAPVPGRPDRRAGADVPGHHVDRLLRRGERQHPHRRHGRGVRAGTDRPVRHRRRAS